MKWEEVTSEVTLDVFNFRRKMKNNMPDYNYKYTRDPKNIFSL